MSYVLAIEPQPEQADALRSAVGANARTTLTIVDSLSAALAAITEEIPDLVLVSALMPARDETRLVARLRALPRRTAPQILITPSLVSPVAEPPRRTLLDRLRRKPIAAAGFEPTAFADHLSTYLDHAGRRSTVQVPATRSSSATLPMDNCQDRRAAVRLERLLWATAQVDGATVDLVDLSSTGAQVLAPIVLQPGGSVEVMLSRGSHAISCKAGIVWGGFEIVGPTRDSWYRAGMHFTIADREAVARFHSGRD